MKKFVLEIDISKVIIKEGKLVIELPEHNCKSIQKDVDSNHPYYEKNGLNGLLGEYHAALAIDELAKGLEYNLSLKEI